MSEVKLARSNSDGSGLPSICMDCGAPSTTSSVRTFSTDTIPLVPPVLDAGALSLLLLPLWGCLAVVKLISWSTARTMTIRTPLCHRHAHGWFTWSGVEAKSITDESIVLAGVSEQFAQALQERRTAEATRLAGAGTSRCRFCATPHDETGRFCTQCGGAR